MNAISPIAIDTLRATCPSIFATGKHHSRSEAYTYIPTIDPVMTLLDKGFVITQAKQSRARVLDRRPFTRHLVRLRAPDIDTGTTAAPEVVLTNAHDGNSRFKIMAGLIVFACENGLVIADGRVEKVAVSHRGNVLADVVASVERIMESTIKTASVVTEWKGVAMSPAMIDLFTTQAMELRYGRDDQGKVKTPISVADAANARRLDDMPDDLWHVFNRVQENLINGGIGYVTSRRDAEGAQRVRNLRTRPVRGIAEDINLNQGLWALAEQFAAA